MFLQISCKMKAGLLSKKWGPPYSLGTKYEILSDLIVNRVRFFLCSGKVLIRANTSKLPA
jgi:hypothetical protein